MLISMMEFGEGERLYDRLIRREGEPPFSDLMGEDRVLLQRTAQRLVEAGETALAYLLCEGRNKTQEGTVNE